MLGRRTVHPSWRGRSKLQCRVPPLPSERTARRTGRIRDSRSTLVGRRTAAAGLVSRVLALAGTRGYGGSNSHSREDPASGRQMHGDKALLHRQQRQRMRLRRLQPREVPTAGWADLGGIRANSDDRARPVISIGEDGPSLSSLYQSSRHSAQPWPRRRPQQGDHDGARHPSSSHYPMPAKPWHKRKTAVSLSAKAGATFATPDPRLPPAKRLAPRALDTETACCAVANAGLGADKLPSSRASARLEETVGPGRLFLAERDGSGGWSGLGPPAQREPPQACRASNAQRPSAWLADAAA